MVQKVVAGVGALFTAIGLIMLIVISVTEDFVIVVIPNSTCTDDNPLGTLGVFTATFTPDCVGATDNEDLESFTTLSPAATPTTQFWPLFPAQQGYGGALDPLVVPAFTTCAAFYEADGAMDRTAVAAAVGSVVQGLNASMVEGYASAQLIGTIAGSVHDALQGLAFPVVAERTPTTLASLKAAAGPAVLILNEMQTAFEAVCTTFDATAAFPVYSGCVALGLPVTAAASSYDLGALIGLEAGGVDQFTSAFYAGVETALGAPGSGIGPATVQSVAGLLSLHRLTGQLGAGDRLLAGAKVLGGAAGIVDPTDTAFDFTGVLTTLTGLSAAGPSFPESLRLAKAVLEVCAPAVTVDGCVFANQTVGGPVPPLLNDASVQPFCLLASSAGQINITSGAVCDYKDIIIGLTRLPFDNITALLAPIFNAPVEVVADLVGEEDITSIRGFVTGCSANPVTFPQCAFIALTPPGSNITPAQQAAGIPGNWSETELALCNLLPPGACATKTFRGFVNAQIAILTAQNDTSTAGAFTIVFNFLCASASSLPECLALIPVTAPSTVGAGPLIANVYEQLNVPDSTEARIAACEDDETDAGIFETAQAMIPAAMALAGIAMIAAIAAAALNKTPIVAVAALLSLAAGGITIGALLYIRTAPVYELVGGDPVDNEPLYKASGGQLLGLLGGVLPLIGGVAMIVSAFLNRPGSSSEMTSKVDNTY